MKKIFISISTICFISCTFSALAQVGIGTTTPNSKAVLELKSPNNNQGFLTPRLTTAQRNAISGLSDSDNGLLVYDTDDRKFYYWHSTQWETLRIGSDSEIQDLKLTGSILTVTNNPTATPINLSAFTGTNTDDQSLSYNAITGLLSITTLSAPSTVTITSPDNTITSAKIVDGTIAAADLNSMSATSGQVLKFNGSSWAPAADAGLLTFTETDPLVKAINGIVKSNGTTISAAIATDFPTLNQNTTGSAGSAAILTTGRTFSLSGDATGVTGTAFNGSANATIPVTLANSGVTAGTYNNVTVDAKGRVTAGTNTVFTETDPLVKAINGIVKSNGTAISAAIAADFPLLNQNTTGSAATLTTGRTFSLSGDATGVTGTAFNGSANATIPVTLANSGVTAGTYNNVTVDAKGRVTAGTNTVFTETDPLVKAINGIVKSNGTTISAAIATDFPTLNQNTTGSAGSAAILTTGRTFSLSGDATGVTGTAFNGSANATIPVTLANSGVTAGTYNNVTVDAKGRVTTGTNTVFTETDPLVKAINGIVKSNGTTISAAIATDFPTLNQNTTGSAGSAAILTTGRTFSLSGDATGVTGTAFNGSANATIPVTLANSGVTAGTYNNVTVDAKGRVTAGTNTVFTETDPLVKAINGIVKSNGTTISAAIATDFPTLNQNTTGSAGSAAILTTGRTIGMTGDVTWTSAAFNGSANVTGTSTIGADAITSAKIADGTIVAADLNSMSAVSGQVLKFNGTAWAPAADNGGATPGLSEVLNAGNSAGGQEAHEFKAISVNWDVKNNPYGALSVDGSQFVGFTEVSLVSSYTVKPTDYLIIADGDAGAKPIQVTLPSAAASKGRIVIVRAVSTNVNSSITVRAADAIDGTTTYSEQLYYSQGIAYSITVLSTGKTWITVNRAVTPAGK